VTDSILNATKKALSVAPGDTSFDDVIIMHINSVFSTLTQLGVGPDQGFSIDDANVLWSSYLNNDERFNNVKSYMYLRVRLLFDPPATSFATTAFEKQIEQLEWRINMQREEEQWTEPRT
jgi:hypothetical protein